MKKRKRRGENYFLNKAVNRFKKGKTYYFDAIYLISVKKLQMHSLSINFASLKYDLDDFIQEGIIFIFDYLIPAYDRKRGAKFTTLFFKEMKHFTIRFMRDNRRREISIDSYFELDCDIKDKTKGGDVFEYVQNISMYVQEPDRRIILNEDIKELYSRLSRRERKIFRLLCKRRYSNSGYDSKILMAYECGIKYHQFKKMMNSIERKYREMVFA